jgi:hypothetical protein
MAMLLLQWRISMEAADARFWQDLNASSINMEYLPVICTRTPGKEIMEGGRRRFGVQICMEHSPVAQKT